MTLLLMMILLRHNKLCCSPVWYYAHFCI